MNLFLSTMKHIKVFLYLQLVEQGVKVTRMKSKWLILFMVFALLITACGGSDTAEETVEESTEEIEEVKDEDLEEGKKDDEEDMKEEVSTEVTHLQERLQKLANIIK